MPTDPFLEEDFRVLTPEAFSFVLTNELKRAQRSQNYVSLVLVEPSFQAVAGDENGEQDQAVGAVARLISRDVRETDLLSHTNMGQLSLVLLDADLDSSARVVERLMARLDNYDFPRPLTFDVGLACCPTHGCDIDSLRSAAESRPIRRRGDRSNAQ